MEESAVEKRKMERKRKRTTEQQNKRAKETKETTETKERNKKMCRSVVVAETKPNNWHREPRVVKGLGPMASQPDVCPRILAVPAWCFISASTTSPHVYPHVAM